MAAMVPISVEFHIHQVVPLFQISNARKERPKKPEALRARSAAISKGIHAIKIKGSNGDTGHAANNNNPLIILNMSTDFFKPEILGPKFGIKKKRASYKRDALFMAVLFLFTTVVRRFFCDINIMCMAFFHTGICNFYKCGLL